MNNSNSNFSRKPKRGVAKGLSRVWILLGQSEENKGQGYLGIFWIVFGISFLLDGYQKIPEMLSVGIFLFSGVYLVTLAMLRRIHRFYYVLGTIITAVFVGIILSGATRNVYLLPIMLGVISLGIIVYGIYFKKRRCLKYVVSGIILLLMVGLVFLLTVGEEARVFLLFFFRSWPVLLIFYGIYQFILLKRFSNSDDEE